MDMIRGLKRISWLVMIVGFIAGFIVVATNSDFRHTSVVSVLVIAAVIAVVAFLLTRVVIWVVKGFRSE